MTFRMMCRSSIRGLHEGIARSWLGAVRLRYLLRAEPAYSQMIRKSPLQIVCLVGDRLISQSEGEDAADEPVHFLAAFDIRESCTLKQQ